MGGENDGEMTLKNKPQLSIDTKQHNKNDDEERQATPSTVASSTPRTPYGVRGSGDLRSPGEKMTPVAQVAKLGTNQGLPDFITQTDASGNATTPRSQQAIQGARQIHPSGPKPRLHVGKEGKLTEDDEDSDQGRDDPCESLFENLRLMCCCLIDDHHVKLEAVATEDSGQVKLLGDLHPEDTGKMCLVLDLDETLVHSSFRPVPNSDFVIPVEVCTAKSPSLFLFATSSFTQPFLPPFAHRLKMSHTWSMSPRDRESTSSSWKWPSTMKLSFTLPVSTSTPIHFWICSIPKR